MEHFSVAITSIGELTRYLDHDLLREHEQDAQGVLVQVYSGSCDSEWIQAVVDILKKFSSKASIVGATTVGEISEGRVKTNTTVVSLSFFQSTSIYPIALAVEPGNEKDATKRFAEAVANINGSCTAGLLLLATPLSIDCNVMLKELYEHHPGLPVFGGGAGDYAGMANTFVFDGDNVFDAGMVAVALVSDTLSIVRHAFLGWKPVGKSMTVTKSDGFQVQEIDGEPAFNVYEQYLGVKADDDFFLNALEFPLLIKRGDQELARVPVAAGDDGSIAFIADINQGEQVRLGYGDASLIIEEARSLQEKIKAFMPQAIYAYSCGCRRFLLQEDAELELFPLESVAPTSGFFTYGEFYDFGDQSPLLNSTIVVVGLREGERKKRDVDLLFDPAADGVGDSDPYHRRHSRVLSRFLYYLESVTKELQVSNQHKSQFLSNMSHELRTPLNAIIGYTEIVKQDLEEKGGHERSVSDLDKVVLASNHLLDLVSGVLDFTKIEAGQIPLQCEYTNLSEVLEYVVVNAQPIMETNNNEFNLMANQEDLVLWLDSKKVLQILLNLLNNAAKFTEQGKIALNVVYEKGTLAFTVSDTGIGIARSHQDRIFEEFRQVDMSHARAHGGAGLGLAISLGLAKLMDGAITVESELGQGSAFTFSFPCLTRP